jgi:hypothetical protein
MFNCDFIQFGHANYASIGLWLYSVDGNCEEQELALEAEEWYSGVWISASRGCLIVSMIGELRNLRHFSLLDSRSLE